MPLLITVTALIYASLAALYEYLIGYVYFQNCHLSLYSILLDCSVA